ncbi:MAG: hypothetical protein QOJ26_1926 [Thermoplasmata archaeon]|nr:hypothetical protein [Thermoplasmata archaeon]MEA3167042.1 hypothetical protein [Thermoplasmata archaeon]
MVVLSVARSFSLAALVLSLAFAGCSSGGDDGGDSSGTGSGSQTSTGPAAGLKAVIDVLINATSAVPSNGSYAVVAGVPVTFDGSNSTGAIVSYNWTFGDNGTGKDETVTHKYAAGGLYDVMLTVKGLGNTTAKASVRIDVAADKTGQFAYHQVEQVTGDLPLMNPNSCTNQGVDCQDHVITVAPPAGMAAVAKHVWINVTGSGSTARDLQVFWRSPEGTTLNSTAAAGLEHRLEYAGDMPPGDYVVRVRLFIGANASYTGTVEIDYVLA